MKVPQMYDDSGIFVNKGFSMQWIIRGLPFCEHFLNIWEHITWQDTGDQYVQRMVGLMFDLYNIVGGGGGDGKEGRVCCCCFCCFLCSFCCYSVDMLVMSVCVCVCLSRWKGSAWSAWTGWSARFSWPQGREVWVDGTFFFISCNCCSFLFLFCISHPPRCFHTFFCLPLPNCCICTFLSSSSQLLQILVLFSPTWYFPSI